MTATCWGTVMLHIDLFSAKDQIITLSFAAPLSNPVTVSVKNIVQLQELGSKYYSKFTIIKRLE